MYSFLCHRAGHKGTLQKKALGTGTPGIVERRTAWAGARNQRRLHRCFAGMYTITRFDPDAPHTTRGCGRSGERARRAGDRALGRVVARSGRAGGWAGWWWGARSGGRVGGRAGGEAAGGPAVDGSGGRSDGRMVGPGGRAVGGLGGRSGGPAA